MTTIFEAREALDKATGIIKQLILDDALLTDDLDSYREYLNFWEEVNDTLRMLDRFEEDSEGVKRSIRYDAMVAEENSYD
jgi:hypothetical protein